MFVSCETDKFHYCKQGSHYLAQSACGGHNLILFCRVVNNGGIFITCGCRMCRKTLCSSYKEDVLGISHSMFVESALLKL